MKKSFLFLVIILLNSCSNQPIQILPNNVKNITLDNLSKLSFDGKLSEEDINTTVYSSSINSVVSINSTSITRNFFNSQVVKGTGSGVIISEDGFIITNYHVIETATKLEVSLSDETKFTAQKIGADKANDIALIKVSSPFKKFQPIPFGDSSNLKVGQKVFAIGNPFGLSGTLTTGIISALNRNLPTDDGTIMRGIIQMDAAINPGNSGGPLLNTKGELIGINTAIFSPNGGNIGIGFAIPVNQVKLTIDKLQKLYNDKLQK
jgi:S1-C subfamily serine protease